VRRVPRPGLLPFQLGLLLSALWVCPQGAALAFTLTSPAFANGAEIPAQHTCAGADLSPALHWSDPPAGTKSLALIVDDPDAPVGTWVHWVLYDVPGGRTDLAPAIAATETLPDGARQGLNDFRTIGYGGPCPPAGKPHRYVFKLYALDASTGLPPRATKNEVLRATAGHVLGQAELMGRYRR